MACACVLTRPWAARKRIAGFLIGLHQLRNTTPQTVNRHYLVADRSKLAAGLKLLEAKIAGVKD
jgi:hypothetical protein